MTDTMAIHISTNSYYQVEVGEAVDGVGMYNVRNLDTGVVEFAHEALPQAVGVAEQYDHMLKHDTWKGLLGDMLGAPTASRPTLVFPDNNSH